jgi:serine protease Do
MKRLCLLLALFSVLYSHGEEDSALKNELALLKRTSRAFTQVAKKTIPAVVAITAETDVEIRYPRSRRFPYGGMQDWYYGNRGGEVYQHQIEQGGTGFLISEDGYILTNTHVVRDVDRIKVKLNDGRVFKAELIGADPRSEVAVIKIDAKDLPYLEFGDSSKLEIGEWVIAIGNQFGFFSESLTVGVVSAKGRSNLALAEYEDFIQTDAAINPGNSGGPLLDIEGKVIGINTAIFSQSGAYVGIGFAIPINMACAVKDQLIKNNGRIIRGYLGVRFNPRDIDDELAKTFGMKKAEGALVSEVLEGTPADKAGIEAGDVIVELNGKRILGIKALTSTTGLMSPGTKARVKVFRNGAEKELSITIGAFPGDDIKGDAKGLASHLGLSVAEITPELARQYGYRETDGVIVSEVGERSLASQAELLPGFVIMNVNQKRVKSVKEFNEALKESAKSRRVIMRVKSPDYTWFVLIPLD